MKVYYIDEDIKGTCFLVQGEQEAILFDPGMAYYGETVVQRVREILGTQPLRAVFLTHSHYDHVAAVPYVRQEWPEIKVYAAEYACHIFEKTNHIMNGRVTITKGSCCMRISRLKMATVLRWVSL